MDRKLYSQSRFSKLDNGLTSSCCNSCSINSENLKHFFLRCLEEWRVWIDVFNFFSPHLCFFPKKMYVQSSGLFSCFHLLTALIFRLSAAVLSRLSGDLPLMTFLSLINNQSLVLYRSLSPSNGIDSILISMLSRLYLFFLVHTILRRATPFYTL